MTSFPENPVQAVSSALAHAYYLQKLGETALYYDSQLSSWVVLSARLTEQVMQHPACKVRPRNLPAPEHLIDRPSASFFTGLIRMNDGLGHQLAKQVILTTLSALSELEIERASQLAHQQLTEELGMTTELSAPALNQWINAFPLYCLANLIGLRDDIRKRLPTLVSTLLICLLPFSTDAALDQADLAFEEFLSSMQASVAMEPINPVIKNLMNTADAVGWHDQLALLINLCGWFSQSYDACRGLLSATLIRLRQHPELDEKIRHQNGYIALFLQEVCRLDSPIQNTRRYTHQALELDGQLIPEDQQILLVLAAANLDASTGPSPLAFSPETNNTPTYTFSYGAHLCPGQNLAMQFARTALPYMMTFNASQAWTDFQYQASANARIALFNSIQE